MDKLLEEVRKQSEQANRGTQKVEPNETQNQSNGLNIKAPRIGGVYPKEAWVGGSNLFDK